MEEDAGGGVMEDEFACSLCGRAFGTELGGEDASEDGTEEGGDARGGDVGEEGAWRGSCPRRLQGQC